MEFYSGLTDSDFGWVITYPQVFLSPLGNVAIVPSLGRCHSTFIRSYPLPVLYMWGILTLECVFFYSWLNVLFINLHFFPFSRPLVITFCSLLHVLCFKCAKISFVEMSETAWKPLRVVYAFSSQPYRRQTLCTEQHVPNVSPGNDWFTVLQVNTIYRKS